MTSFKDSPHDKILIKEGWGIVGNGAEKDLKKLRKKGEKRNPNKTYAIFQKAYTVYGEFIHKQSIQNDGRRITIYSTIKQPVSEILA